MMVSSDHLSGPTLVVRAERLLCLTRDLIELPESALKTSLSSTSAMNLLFGLSMSLSLCNPAIFGEILPSPSASSSLSMSL